MDVDIRKRKWEVIEPFSIRDLYNVRSDSVFMECSIFDKEFFNLLAEYAPVYDKFKTFDQIKQSKTLMNNLSWLEKQGWIEKEHEYPWVNIFTDGTTSLNYSTEQKALEGSVLSSAEYVTTVQLKPQKGG